MFFYAFHCILCIVLLQEQDSDFFLYTELKNNNKNCKKMQFHLILQIGHWEQDIFTQLRNNFSSLNIESELYSLPDYHSLPHSLPLLGREDLR